MRPLLGTRRYVSRPFPAVLHTVLDPTPQLDPGIPSRQCLWLFLSIHVPCGLGFFFVGLVLPRVSKAAFIRVRG
jgi:hypothetical protein